MASTQATKPDGVSKSVTARFLHLELPVVVSAPPVRLQPAPGRYSAAGPRRGEQALGHMQRLLIGVGAGEASVHVPVAHEPRPKPDRAVQVQPVAHVRRVPGPWSVGEADLPDVAARQLAG